MLITSQFDGGNIEVISAEKADEIRLQIRKDNQSDFYQWFYFHLSGVEDQLCTLIIENAGGAAYADGWKDYNVCASYDRESWFRIPTDYDGTKLTFELDCEQNGVYFAYFAPYSMERHHDLIANAAQTGIVTPHVLGHTIDGQSIDMLELGLGAEGRKPVWLIARQHPGETMAEWWMEGALDMLTDMDDPVTRALLDAYHFYIVPNMNPDGSKRGHLRTNAAGVNLNRVWNNPSLETSPEVYHVRAKMAETGVAFHLDVHGDEALPYNFIAGYEGIPDLTEAHLQLLDTYQTHLVNLSPDFQREHGYPIASPGNANMSLCTNYIAHAHQCLAMTLEMPFKDNANLPDPVFGWSPERCGHLARACLSALLRMKDAL